MPTNRRSQVAVTPPRAAAGGRRQRKRQKTQDHLAATAFRLFEALGYEAVTMERIAEEADVAKGTLYKHFPVKEALVAHQFRTEIAQGMNSLRESLERQPDFYTRMKMLLRASAEWTSSRRAYLPHYLRLRWMTTSLTDHPSRADTYSSGSYQILLGLFQQGQTQGAVRPDLNVKLLAAAFEFMVAGAGTLWLSHPEVELEDYFKFMLELMWHGASSRSSQSVTGKRQKARR